MALDEQKRQQMRDRLQQAGLDTRRENSVSSIIKELEEQKAMVEASKNTQEKDSFAKTMVKEFVTPFAQFGTSGKNFFQATSKFVQGEYREAEEELEKPSKYRFLGEISPYGTFTEKNQSLKEGVKDIFAGGSELGSMVVGGGAAKNLALTPFKTILKQSILRGMKEEAVASGSYALGKALDEDKQAVEVISDSVIGTLSGLLAGGGTFGLGTLLGKGTRLGSKSIFDVADSQLVQKGVFKAKEKISGLGKLKERAQTAWDIKKGKGVASEEMVQQELKDVTSQLINLTEERESIRRALSKTTKERGFNPLEEVGLQGITPDFRFSKGRAVIDFTVGRDKLRGLVSKGAKIITEQLKKLDDKALRIAGVTGESVDVFSQRVLNIIKKSDLKSKEKETLIKRFISEAKAMKREYGDSISLEDINNLRKQYNRGFKGEDYLTPDLDYAVASASREALDDLVQDQTVRRANAQIGKWIEAEKFLAKQMDGKQVGSGRLGLWFGRLIGSNIAERGGLQAVIGAFGGDWTVKFIQKLQYSSPIRKRILENLKQEPQALKDLLENSSEQTIKYIKSQLERLPKMLSEPKKSAPVSKIKSGKIIEMPEKAPSIKTAKASGQSFDEWVKRQGPSTKPISSRKKTIEIKDLFAHGESELKDAIRNVENGAISRTKGIVEVTQTPTGEIVVLNGQHRVVEAMKRGNTKIKINVVPYEDAINPDFGYTVRNLIVDGEPVPFKTRSQLKAEWDNVK